MLASHYRLQMDDKFRIRLPAKLRQELGEKPYIMPGKFGELRIYSNSEAETYLEDIKNQSEKDAESMKKAVRFMVNVQEIIEDAQGRFVLNENLRNYAKIKKDIVFVGLFNKIVLYSAEEFEKLYGLDKVED